ncbi:hypothetical protein B0T16DRAFT_397957 [Cercophora newfieldiana]|uniref:Uncharacterized protein n=1 Tax=Cercophora newfieldiana TaxID=92897 RepID=A0AA40CY94_9PEZI|nr:hypothetical protein B0T16DRAFT_397957 [Cercophora newfieldiana]
MRPKTGRQPPAAEHRAVRFSRIVKSASRHRPDAAARRALHGYPVAKTTVLLAASTGIVIPLCSCVCVPEAVL